LIKIFGAFGIQRKMDMRQRLRKDFIFFCTVIELVLAGDRDDQWILVTSYEVKLTKA